jgi:hypothetical protein
MVLNASKSRSNAFRLFGARAYSWTDTSVSPRSAQDCTSIRWQAALGVPRKLRIVLIPMCLYRANRLCGGWFDR